MSTFKLNSGYDIPVVGLGTWVRDHYLFVHSIPTLADYNSYPNHMKSRTPSNMPSKPDIAILTPLHAT